MQEENPLIQQLIDCINENLANHIPSNASFLAERLIAEKDTEETRNLLAECQMAEGKPQKAQYILKDCKSPQNRYIFALNCQKLNKLKDAENCFKDSIPNGCQGHYLLGLIFEKQQKFKDAQLAFKNALEINPTLFNAYEKLCKLGVHLKEMPSDKIFNENRYQNYITARKSMKTEYPPTKIYKNENEIVEEQKESQQFNLPPQIAQEMEPEQPMGPTQSVLNLPGKQPKISQKKIMAFTGKTLKPDEEKQSKKPTGKSTTFQQFFQEANKKKTFEKVQVKQQQPKKIQSINILNIFDVMSLLKMLSEPFALMNEQYCQEAIEQFLKLPESQFHTGWVLSNIGRCYMELIKYNDAETQFSEAQRREPYRLESLEYYSSCLWHLKKQVESCYLAYEALEKSIFAPEAWIAVGNCFSLQKEHENALKFFGRAIQLNPNNPYPHTLCGHEHVQGEDFQKAKKCFETALSLDVRHQNAWWGLGNINYKQEKQDRAIEQFQRAIHINPKCPILQSYLGMTYASKRDFNEALKHQLEGERLDSSCLLNKFQKANVLVQLEQQQMALKELDTLRLLMPKEAPIPILMGKIYKKLGKIDKAQLFFTQALDLDQKDAQKIKGLIEGLHTNNEFNEGELDF